MVSFRELFELEDLEFHSGREYTYDGVAYHVGDQIPNELVAGAKNRESLIRGRYAVPTVDDLNDLPRQYQREVMLKSRFDIKYPAAVAEADEPLEQFAGEEHSIAAVKAYLTENATIETWAYSLVEEVNDEARAELIIWIKAGNEDVDPEDLADFVYDEANYANGEALEDFDYDADLYANSPPSEETVAEFFAGDHTVQATKDYLGQEDHLNVQDWAYGLLSEYGDKNRVTLMEWIEAGQMPDVNPANLESFVTNASNYDPGEVLEDFEAADGVAIYA